MISGLFVLSLLLAALCLRRKCALQKLRAEGRMAFGLYSYSFEFFAALAVSLAFYHLLLLLLYAGWQYVSMGWLLRLERSLDAVRRACAQWTPGWTVTLAILVGIYLLSLLQVRIFQSPALLRSFKKTKTALRIANIFLVALTSFTLLGSEAGEPLATLRIHLRTVRSEYGLLRQQVQDTILGSTLNRVYERTTVALGTRYASAPQWLERSETSAATLRQRYGLFQQEYNVPDVPVEQALNRYERRESARRSAEAAAAGLITAESQRALSSSSRRPAAEVTAPAAEFVLEGAPPERASYSRLRRASEEVSRVSERTKPGLIRVLSRPQGREIALHFTALIKSSKAAELALQELIGAYPILKPAFQIVTSVAADAAAKALGREIDKATAAIVEDPGSAERSVVGKAEEIAASVDVKIPPRARTEVARQAESMESEAVELQSLGSALAQRARGIESAKVEKLLADFQSSDEEVRQTAAESLAEMSTKLDSGQKARLAAIERARIDTLLSDLQSADAESGLKASETLAELKDKMDSAQKARLTEIENSRVDALISDLQSAGASGREGAATSLSRMGDSLSREQVDRLVDMMRTDPGTAATSSSRGAHCTWYETRSTKYYAGKALEEMESPHVTRAIKAEAEKAQASGASRRRVDDPGWT